MSDPDVVRRSFDELRAHCDPQGHDLLQSLEELCIEAVDMSRTIAAHVAVLEHEQRVRKTLDGYVRHLYTDMEWAEVKAEERMGKWPNLRSIGR